MRVRELPILFNDEMVQALLTGRKTCTRRAIELPDKMTGRPIGKSGDSSNPLGFFYPGGIKRPPYQPGDILYVKETWRWCPCWDCGLDAVLGCCKYEKDSLYNNSEKEYGCYKYRASCGNYGFPATDIWRPSIHMPKEVARIWLKVTNVRVERLQNITEAEAILEGATNNIAFIHSPDNEYDHIHTAREHFVDIWNSTIKKGGIDKYGWDANPFVWVIEFEWCEKPGKE